MATAPLETQAQPAKPTNKQNLGGFAGNSIKEDDAPARTQSLQKLPTVNAGKGKKPQYR